MTSALLIHGTWGLGDCIFARPFIRAACDKHQVWLETPWPELFEDLPLRFVKARKTLRTQMQNVLLQPDSRWSAPPHGMREVTLSYGNAELERGSVVDAIERSLPWCLNPQWDLPQLGPCPVDTGGAPLAVIRPVTCRREWQNDARSPRPEYIDYIASDLKRRGFAVVVVAHLSGIDEALVSELPPHNAAFVNGEFDVRQLLALVRDADVVVGGVGWIVPAAIALKSKAFIVLGGQGGHNGPNKITDRRMDLSRIGFAKPDQFCPCTNMRHECDKRISTLEQQFHAWAESSGLYSTTRSPVAA